jgi:hypothetical protein
MTDSASCLPFIRITLTGIGAGNGTAVFSISGIIISSGNRIPITLCRFTFSATPFNR